MQPGVHTGLEGVVFVVVTVEHSSTEHCGGTQTEGHQPAKRHPELSKLSGLSQRHTKLHPRKFKLT